MTKTFFTSDTHYFHENGRTFFGRPFKDVDEMHEEMIARWNGVVAPTDTVYHLGDVTFNANPEKMASVLTRLNGIKHLILGNHDEKIQDRLALHFVDIQQYKVIKAGNLPIVLFHYPIHSWDGAFHGALHFHGHTHGRASLRKNRLDVGVDCNDFTPITLEEAVDKIYIQNTEKLCTKEPF